LVSDKCSDFSSLYVGKHSTNKIQINFLALQLIPGIVNKYCIYYNKNDINGLKRYYSDLFKNAIINIVNNPQLFDN
jgi:hypothetical protein